ncbi:ABC transporter ATP-binding protein [Halobacteria archaeon AArc-m2/3/4]|uniref:ABC transporter ATP-binding protein n=1 Tax=Natronoglomus mannanivorans TaxID=2979990 RepID=A0AAP2Z339_9EURY|nr:ABC transporter ATP-binding protein [Halobacteria archaeon AArc-xg1-1]MCU4974064.1 ABC transporter ATP-binding protein [Halobacteria archaeon AArc-m2/3/4]
MYGATETTTETREQSKDTIIEVRNASVTFDMNRGRGRVLDDVDLDVYRGETLGIAGESGSGKSMLASALLDAVEDPGMLTGDVTYYPEDGDPIDILELDNSDLQRLRWEEIAMVFQGAMDSFNPTVPIKAHFVDTLEAHNADVEEGLQRARSIMHDLNLDPERILEVDTYQHELSGGQRQRILIALSLILEPELLVLDEPTGALDLLMQRKILKLLHEIKDDYNLTMLIVSHDLPIISAFADRVGVMYAFELVERGDVEDVLYNPSHPYTRSLLRATPDPQTPLDEITTVDGSAPDPVNIPSGCTFHPRCPVAGDRCEIEEPDMVEVDDETEHVASCFYQEEGKEEIPAPVSKESGDFTFEVDDTWSRHPIEDPILELEDVSVRYKDPPLTERTLPDSILERLDERYDIVEPPVHALTDVSLELGEEDVLVLVGESGSGKSTLGRTAIGLEEPTEGSVKYDGYDVQAVERGEHTGEILFEDVRRAMQIIHQDPSAALNPYRTIRSSLSQPLKRWHSDMDLNDRRARIKQMLESTGIRPAEEYMERYPNELSGGEQQRVSIIRAMLIEPNVILSDEVVSALDVSLRVELMNLLLDMQDTFSTSYLFISHNLTNARYFAGKANGRIAVMYLGQIVETGPIDEVLSDPKHPYTKILKWATLPLDPDSARETIIEESPIVTEKSPDPRNPPSGCSFHEACPKAREACTQTRPKLDSDGNQLHRAACFRDDPDHEYWQSEPLHGEEREIPGE